MAFTGNMVPPEAFGPSMFSGGGQPAGGTTYTDMLSSLSGALPDINNGIQSLAYGIGSFAKDPRKREMYIQAALAHQQHMSQDKAQHLKALQDHGDKLLEFIQQSAGNPQVLNVLKPVIDQHVRALGALGGKDAATQWSSLAQAAEAVPPDTTDKAFTLGPRDVRYGSDNKVVARGADIENAAKPTTSEEFDALPIGAWFINPADGKLMQKTKHAGG